MKNNCPISCPLLAICIRESGFELLVVHSVALSSVKWFYGTFSKYIVGAIDIKYTPDIGISPSKQCMNSAAHLYSTSTSMVVLVIRRPGRVP